MKGIEKDLPSKLRDLGIKVVKTAKKGIKEVKTSVEHTLLEEHLKKRFNLENPYRFVVVSESKKLSVLDELTARHAKRYDEDDLFVFFGKLDKKEFGSGKLLVDLSNNAEYKIKDLLEVTVPIEYNHEVHEVLATAVMCSVM